MAEHKVTFTLPERELGKADVDFSVKRDGVKVGTLRISKGGLEWVPRDHEKGHHISWLTLQEFAESNGRKK